ncbi:hypothetical protein F2Q69_00007576 [Brassica cretica]|uniref:Uncharacterized protein n=1 Tax=Brassica cretica TaxID=69181 RepID=A0A8S9NVY7_BRACR|nr:hypothetical protein F2Q69_00007576 [Brassica cretica]
MTNDNNTSIDTTNVIQTPLNVAATDATGVTTAGTITPSTAAATTTTTLPVGNAADETARRSLFGAGLYQMDSVSGTTSGPVAVQTPLMRSKHYGIEARWENPKLGENPNFGIMIFSRKSEDREIFSVKDRNLTNGPRSSRCLIAWDQNVVSTVQQAECLHKLEVSPCMEASCRRPSGRGCVILHVTETCSQPCGARGAASKLSVYISSRCRRAWKQYMQPDIRPSRRGCVVLHVTETCSQPCGARGATAHASGAMRSNTRAATNLMLIERFRGQFSTDFESAPREGSVQLKVNQVKISSDGKHVNVGQSVPLMIKWRCCPELVQFHGFRSVEVLLDTPPGSPKNCPKTKEDQSSPLQSSRQSGFGQVLSDQPAASRLEHLQVPVIFKDSVLAGGRTIWCFLNLVPSGFKETPYSLDREPSERRGQVPWLSGYTDGVVTGSDPTVLGLTRGDPADIAEDDEKEHEVTRAQVRVLCCVVLECRRGLWNPRVPVIFKDSVVVGGRTIWVLTLSLKSGLGTRLGLVCIWFPLFEARSWQEAKSNFVTVAGRGRQVTEKHYVTHPTTLSFLQVALGKDDRIAGCWTLGPPV